MRKKTRSLLLVLSTACVFGTAYAQQQVPANNTWTLQEAVDYALQNNLGVKQAKITKEVAGVNLKQSRFNMLPSVNANGSQTYNYGSSVDPLTSEFRTQEVRSNNFSLASSLPVFQGFQLQNQVKQNRALLAANASDVEAMQNNITLQVVNSYLNLLFGKELLKVAELQLANTREQLKRTRILYDAGSVAQTNVLELESQEASDELSVINAQNQIDIYKLTLAQLLDLESMAGFDVIIPEIPSPTLNPQIVSAEQVYDAAVQTQPTIQSADLRVLGARYGVNVAKAAYYPRFNVGAAIFTGYSSARPNPFSEPVPGSFSRQLLGFQNSDGTNPFYIYFPDMSREDYTFSEQLDDNLGKQLQFTLSVPIFNGLQARSAVQRAQLNEESARINAEQERNTLRQTIEQAAADAQAALKRYIASKRQLESIEQSYKNAELRLNKGVINATDFNVLANNYRRAQSDLLQAKYEYFFKLKILDFYQGKEIKL